MAANTDAFGNMIRVVRNLYNAVFENATIKKRNSPYRQSITVRGGLLVGEQDAGLYTAPYAREGTDLFNSGTAYNPTTGIVTGVTIRQTAQSYIIDYVTRGWMFARFTPSWVESSPPNANPYVCTARSTATDGIYLLHESGQWAGHYGTNTPVTANYNHAAGEMITLCFAWDKGTNLLSLWINAAAPVTQAISVAALADIRGLSATQFGYSGIDVDKQLNATIQMYAIGTGVMTTAKVAQLRAMYPNAIDAYHLPPGFNDLSFLWDGQSATVHEYLGIAGVSVVGAA